MKHTPRSSSRAVAALLIALAPPSFAESPTPHDRPFHGRIEGRFVATPTENPAIYLSEVEATGLATHLGAFTKVTSDVVNVVTGEVEGTFTMTAPSGDLLSGVYSGFLFFGAEPGTFSWVLDAGFTGGTGRFSDAAGEFVFIAEGTFVIVDGAVHGEYTETYDGSVSY